MTVNLTVIGLGRIGKSVGLALAAKKDLITCTGNDADAGNEQMAVKAGAFEVVQHDLAKAVKDADIVLITEPMGEFEDTVKLVVPHLKEGAVMLGAVPVHKATLEMVTAMLPEDRYYLSFMPTLNPAHLNSNEPSADLFKKSLIVLSSLPHTLPEALQLASDLCRLLGAQPFYPDPDEADGLMAAGDTLPRLMSAALLLATVNAPGWREGQKLAGSAYLQASEIAAQPHEDEDLTPTALLNRENTLRVLDDAIAALQILRRDIDEQDGEMLQAHLRSAREKRDAWWEHRKAVDWELPKATEPIPTAGQAFGRLFGFRPRPTNKDKK